MNEAVLQMQIVFDEVYDLWTCCAGGQPARCDSSGDMPGKGCPETKNPVWSLTALALHLLPTVRARACPRGKEHSADNSRLQKSCAGQVAPDA